MGMSSFDCLVCGRAMMSDSKESYCHDSVPSWMWDVVVFMPDGVKIAGEYTGYKSVKTGEVVRSKWSRKLSKRHAKRNRDNGRSTIHPEGQIAFDKKADKADHGYWAMHQFWQGIVTPSCYHRACWEAVGSPEGYRAPSLGSRNQGFGSGAWMHHTVGETEESGIDDDFVISKPTHPEALQLWAVNSVVHFIYLMGYWIRANAHAEKERAMWRALDGFKESMERGEELLKEYEDLK